MERNGTAYRPLGSICHTSARSNWLMVYENLQEDCDVSRGIRAHPSKPPSARENTGVIRERGWMEVLLLCLNTIEIDCSIALQTTCPAIYT